MPVEKCKNCGLLIVQRDDGSWMHQISTRIGGQHACGLNGEPGMGLTEMINQYRSAPGIYANWVPSSDAYTSNCIQHSLVQQATIHWNCCSKTDLRCIDARCTQFAKSQADMYMQQLANGRHDLTVEDDREVHSLAFKIHDKRIADGTHVLLTGRRAGREGVLTATYVVGPGSSEACDCYEQAFERWVKDKEMKALMSIPMDPEDLHWEERFD